MAHLHSIFLPVVYFLLGLVSCGPIPPPKEKYFTQVLDHFNFQDTRTFQERIWYSDDHWKHSGPLFFYTGNEGPISEFYDNSGFIFDLAEKFNALVVFAEHRYYGKSKPFGDDSFKPHNVGYLSVEQALADYAVLIEWLKSEFHMAEDAPVITFGGSYGGSLSAYMRMHCPTVVDAALAASAPILLYEDETNSNAFFHIVTKDFYDYHPECVHEVRKAYQEIYDLSRLSKFDTLSTKLRLCSPVTSFNQAESDVVAWIRNAFTYIAMLDYPYATDFLDPLPAWPVHAACEELMKPTGDAYRLNRLANAIGIYYNGTKNLQCFNISAEFFQCADASGCGGSRTDPTALAWDYQACTEIIHDIGTNGVTDMFPPRPWSVAKLTQYCNNQWGVSPRPHWMPLNTPLKTSSRIIFSNGDLDPWHVGGVLHNISDTLIAIQIPQAAHHLDLRAPNPADPPSVTEARKQETRILEGWLKQISLEKRNKSVL